MNDTNYTKHIPSTLENDDEFKLLVHRISEEETRSQWVVESLVRKYGKQAVPYLIPLLTDEDEDFAREVAEWLGKLKDPRAVQPLIDALSSEAFYVRYEAALALEQIGDERSKPHFEKVLKEIYSDEDLDMWGCVTWDDSPLPFEPPLNQRPE